MACLFLIQSTELRIVVLVLAALTDYLDGFFARLWRNATQFGAVLDPLMDKLFIFTVVVVLAVERSLSPVAIVALLMRDICLAVFGVYLLIKRRWRNLRYRSVFWGKATTLLQYALLLAVLLGLPVPTWAYALFIPLGLLFFTELCLVYRQPKSNK